MKKKKEGVLVKIKLTVVTTDALFQAEKFFITFCFDSRQNGNYVILKHLIRIHSLVGCMSQNFWHINPCGLFDIKFSKNVYEIYMICKHIL